MYHRNKLVPICSLMVEEYGHFQSDRLSFAEVLPRNSGSGALYCFVCVHCVKVYLIESTHMFRKPDCVADVAISRISPISLVIFVAVGCALVDSLHWRYCPQW